MVSSRVAPPHVAHVSDAIKFAVYCDKKSVPINAEGKRVPGWVSDNVALADFSDTVFSCVSESELANGSGKGMSTQIMIRKSRTKVSEIRKIVCLICTSHCDVPDIRLWQALGLPIKPGEVEPAGKPGQLYETPPHLMSGCLTN